jgi:hypothetical protein
LAFSFITLAVVGPTTEKAEAVAPLVVVGVALASAAIGYMISEYLHDSNDAALINAETAKAYAASLSTTLKNSMGLAQARIHDMPNEIELLNYYFIRKAQWAARDLYLNQTASGAAHTYNWDYVLERSEIMPDLAEYTKYAVNQPNAVFDAFRHISSNFTGAYSADQYGFIGTASGTKELLTEAANPNLDVNLFVKSRSDGSKYYYDGESSLYLLRTSTGYTGYIKDITGTTIKYQKTLNSDYAGSIEEISNTTINLPAGIYTFYGPWIGPLTPVSSTAYPYLHVQRMTSTDTKGTPAALFFDADLGNYAYSLGTTAFAATLSSFKIGFYSTADDKSNSSHNYYVQGLMEDTKTLMDKMKSTLDNVYSFAQSYYNQIVVTGDPGADYGLPLMLMPDPSQMDGLTWEQIYALYVAYLQQAYLYYQEHADDLNADSVNITAESLKLKIRGSVVNQTGVTLYDNTTIWTPFVTTQSVTLTIGANSWPCAAYGIKWGNANAIANLTNSTTAALINLEEGYTIYIQEIMYDGEYVTSLDLDVTTVEITIVEQDTPPAPPAVLTDLDWLLSRWYYFAIVAGLICLIASISFRNTAIIIIGLVLLAAGVIGYYLAGDFSILDALNLSITPPNLTTWLQNLR